MVERTGFKINIKMGLLLIVVTAAVYRGIMATSQRAHRSMRPPLNVPTTQSPTILCSFILHKKKTHLPRENKVIRVEQIPDESKHCNAAVFDLRVPQEADGLLLRRPPEVGLGQLQGVVKSDRGIELLGQDLEVSEGLREPRGGRGGGRRGDERRRR